MNRSKMRRKSRSPPRRDRREEMVDVKKSSTLSRYLQEEDFAHPDELERWAGGSSAPHDGYDRSSNTGRDQSARGERHRRDEQKKELNQSMYRSRNRDDVDRDRDGHRRFSEHESRSSRHLQRYGEDRRSSFDMKSVKSKHRDDERSPYPDEGHSPTRRRPSPSPQLDEKKTPTAKRTIDGQIKRSYVDSPQRKMKSSSPVLFDERDRNAERRSSPRRNQTERVRRWDASRHRYRVVERVAEDHIREVVLFFTLYIIFVRPSNRNAFCRKQS